MLKVTEPFFLGDSDPDFNFPKISAVEDRNKYFFNPLYSVRGELNAR
jgi:hypothetical protein